MFLIIHYLLAGVDIFVRTKDPLHYCATSNRSSTYAFATRYVRIAILRFGNIPNVCSATRPAKGWAERTRAPKLAA